MMRTQVPPNPSGPASWRQLGVGSAANDAYFVRTSLKMGVLVSLAT
jgi:hypothetical protein